MKVYRALPYIDTQSLLRVGYRSEGENFEGSNLLNFGLCSPSFEFLDNNKNPYAKLNTFNVNGLAKYFYVSFLDCLLWAYNIVTRFVGFGIIGNVLIWEVDLPDCLVEKHLGTGEYNSIRKIEAKIPYDELCGYLGHNVDISLLEKLKEFFNKYYSWRTAPLPDLAELLKYLPSLDFSNPDITFTSDNEMFKKAYSNLCFPIYMSYKIMYSENPSWIYDAYYLTLKGGFNGEHLKRAKQLYTDYENWANLHRGDFSNYLVKQMEFYQEENAQLKRVLASSDYSFKKR